MLASHSKRKFIAGGLGFAATALVLGLSWVQQGSLDSRTRATSLGSTVVSSGAPISFYGTTVNFLKLFGQTSYKETTQDATVPNKIYHASGIAIDKTDTIEKIYVVDTGNNRILGFNGWKAPDQSADLIIGQLATDTGSCNGDNNLGIYSQASAQSLCLTGFPLSTNTAEYWMRTTIDTDSQGNLYVPDVWNNRVLKYNQPFSTDKTGGKGDAVADAVWGQDDMTGHDRNKSRGVNAPSADSLNLSKGGFDNVSSRGVSVDAAGNVWVADTFNFRVLRFPPNSKTADLVIGQPDFTSPTSIPAQQSACEQSITGRSLNTTCTPTVAKVNPANGKLYVLDESPMGFKARLLVYSPPFTSGMAADKVITPQQPGAFQNTSWQYYFQATGFSFNTSTVPEYAAGTLWVNEHDARRTILIDDNGTIIKVIGAPDAVHKGCDYPYYNQCGTSNETPFNLCWPGGSPAFDNAGNIYLADEQFNRIARFALPYQTSTQGSNICLPNSNGGLMQGTAPNSMSGAKFTTGIVGAVVAGNQLILKDKQRYLVWNDYLNKADGASADLVMGQTSFTEKLPAGLGSRSGHGVDDLNRLWMLNDKSGNDQAGKLLVYQLPIAANAQPIAKDIQLFWQDDPGTAVVVGTFEGGLTFDPIHKALWIADRFNHRLLRVSNYKDVTTGKLFVDAVLGQPDKLHVKCNNDQDYAWTAPGAPKATSLCDPRNLSVDAKGNLYVVENTYECHGNDRITMFESGDLAGISTLFPSTAAKKVFVRNSLTEQVSCNGGLVNEPYSPVSVAFDSLNHMVVGNDGYYGSDTERAWKQLWYYCDPLKKDGSGNYVQGQKPDASIKLPIGAAGAVTFDSADNLVVQDHTWARAWVINPAQDPAWLIPQNGAPSGAQLCSAAPTPTPGSVYDPVNKALNKTATSNRADSVGTQTPDKANDGDTTTANRAWQVNNPLNTGDWWQVDLGSSQSVAKVVIYPNAVNYHDFCTLFHIQTSATGAFAGEQATVVTETQRPETQQDVYSFPSQQARYVRITCDETRNWIQLQEVEVYGLLNQPSATPTLGIAPSPTPSPTTLPTPTLVPSATPTPLPTKTPTQVPTPTPVTLSFVPTDDAYVVSNKSLTNFGKATRLVTDGNPTSISYLKFDLTGLAGKTILSAKLRIKVAEDKTSGTQRLKPVASVTWSESTITYVSRPAVGSTILATFTAPTSNTWKEISLDSYIMANIGQKISFALDTTSSDTGKYYSKETTDKPVLVVTY